MGYRYGCYAENEVASYTEWTPKEILRRGLNLLSLYGETVDTRHRRRKAEEAHAWT